MVRAVQQPNPKSENTQIIATSHASPVDLWYERGAEVMSVERDVEAIVCSPLCVLVSVGWLLFHWGVPAFAHKCFILMWQIAYSLEAFVVIQMCAALHNIEVHAMRFYKESKCYSKLTPWGMRMCAALHDLLISWMNRGKDFFDVLDDLFEMTLWRSFGAAESGDIEVRRWRTWTSHVIVHILASSWRDLSQERWIKGQKDETAAEMP